MVHLIHQSRAIGLEDPDEMHEQRLPNAEFELMHEIYNQHGKEVESKLGQPCGKGIL